jgi:uncharacterized protein YkwD
MRKVLKHYFVPHEDNEYAPHFFRDTCFTFLAMIIIALLSLSMAGSFVASRTGLLGAIYASVLVDLANKDRGDTKLGTLSINPLLEKAASLKVDDMVSKSYFAHKSPEGLTPWYWFNKANYSFIYAGENLAINFTESDAVNNAWMASPGHRANILNANFTEVGIAVKEGVYNGNNTIFVVQMFGKPSLAIKKEAPKAVVVEKPKTVITKENVQIVPAPVVKGESVKIINEVTSTDGTQSLLVVKNTEVEENIELVSDMTPVKENQKYSTWFERLFMRTPLIIKYIYFGLGAIVALAVLLLIGVEIKHQHPKSIAYGLFLLLIIGGAFYINSTTELSQLAQLL